MLINPVMYFAVIVFSLVEVNSQVCLTQTIVTRMVLETFSYSYFYTYGYTAHVKTKINERYVKRTHIIETKYCCNGYSKESNDLKASEETCKPICESNCTNGYCKHPGECACNAGYTKRNDTCAPLCEGDCLHGTCVAPNTCQCDSGYKLVSDTCQPVCTTCINDTYCSAPETCECFSGYKLSKKTYCDCCYSHICVGSVGCRCSPGLSIERKSETIECVPECKNPCGNGTCVNPNECNCFPGYTINYLRQYGYIDGPVCVPKCNNCSGICVAPYKCVEEYTSMSTSTSTSTSTANTSAVSIIATSTTLANPIPKSRYRYDDTTTTTKALYLPLKTNSISRYHNDTTTTTTSYFISSRSSTERVVNNDADSNVTLGHSNASSWMQQHGKSIYIPVTVLVTIGIIMFLVWRRTPMIIINFFRGKSYDVQGALLKRNGSESFENVQFVPNERTNER